MKKLGLIVTYKDEKGEELFFMPWLMDADSIPFADNKLLDTYLRTTQNISVSDEELNLINKFKYYKSTENSIDFTQIHNQFIFTKLLDTKEKETEEKDSLAFYHLKFGTIKVLDEEKVSTTTEKEEKTEIITSTVAQSSKLNTIGFQKLTDENLTARINTIELNAYQDILIQKIKPKTPVQPDSESSSKNQTENSDSQKELNNSETQPKSNESKTEPQSPDSSIHNNIEIKPKLEASLSIDQSLYFTEWLSKQTVKPKTITVELDIVANTAHSFLTAALQTSAANSAALTKQELLDWVKQPNIFQLAGDKYFDANHYSDFANWLEEQDDVDLTNQLQQLSNPLTNTTIARQYRRFLDDVVSKRLAHIGNNISNAKNVLQQHFKIVTAHSFLITTLQTSAPNSTALKKELLVWINESHISNATKESLVINLSNFAKWLETQDDKADLVTLLENLYKTPSVPSTLSEQYFQFLENVVSKRIAFIENNVTNPQNILESQVKAIAAKSKPTVGYVIFSEPTGVDSKLISEIKQQAQHNLIFDIHSNKNSNANIDKASIIGKFHAHFNQPANWLTWKKTEQLIIPAQAKQDCFVIKINSSKGITIGTNETTVKNALEIEHTKYLKAFEAAIKQGITKLYLIPDQGLNDLVSVCLQIGAAKNAGYEFDDIFVENMDQSLLKRIKDFVKKEINYTITIRPNNFSSSTTTRPERKTLLRAVESTATGVATEHEHAKNYARLVRELTAEKAAHDKKMEQESTEHLNKEFKIQVKVGKYFNLPLDWQILAAEAAGISKKNIEGIPKPQKTATPKTISTAKTPKNSGASGASKESVSMFTIELARWLTGHALKQSDMVPYGTKGPTPLLGSRDNWKTQQVHNNAPDKIKQTTQNRAKAKELVFLLLKDKFSIYNSKLDLTHAEKKQFAKYLQELAWGNEKIRTIIGNINVTDIALLDANMPLFFSQFQANFNQHSTDVIDNTIFEYLHTTPRIAIETGNLELLQFLAKAGMDLKEKYFPVGNGKLLDAMDHAIHKLTTAENPNDWRMIEWLTQNKARQLNPHGPEATLLFTTLLKATIRENYSKDYLKRINYFINYFCNYDSKAMGDLFAKACEKSTGLTDWLSHLLTPPANNPAAIKQLITEIGKYTKDESIITQLNDILLGMAGDKFDCAYLSDILTVYPNLQKIPEEDQKKYPAEKLNLELKEQLIKSASINFKFLREFNLYCNNTPAPQPRANNLPASNNAVPINDGPATNYLKLYKKGSKFHSRNITAEWANKFFGFNDENNNLMLLASLYLHDKSSALYKELSNHIIAKRKERHKDNQAKQNVAENEKLSADQEAKPVQLSFLSQSYNDALLNDIQSIITNPASSNKVVLQLLARAHGLECSLSYKFADTATKQQMQWEIAILHRAVETILFQPNPIPNTDAALELAARNIIRKTAEIINNQDIKSNFLNTLNMPALYTATALWEKNYKKESQPCFFKPIKQHDKITLGHSRLRSEEWLNSITTTFSTPELIEIYYHAYSTLYQQSKNSELAKSIQQSLAIPLGLDPTKPWPLTTVTERIQNSRFCPKENTHREQLLEHLFTILHKKEKSFAYILWNRDKIGKEIDHLQQAIVTIVTNRPIQKNADDIFKTLENALANFSIQLNASNKADPTTWVVEDKTGTNRLFKTWSNLPAQETTASSLSMQHG